MPIDHLASVIIGYFTQAKNTSEFITRLHAKGIDLYERQGKPIGIIINNKRYRFSRLGFSPYDIREIQAQVRKEQRQEMSAKVSAHLKTVATQQELLELLTQQDRYWYECTANGKIGITNGRLIIKFTESEAREINALPFGNTYDKNKANELQQIQEKKNEITHSNLNIKTMNKTTTPVATPDVEQGKTNTPTIPSQGLDVESTAPDAKKKAHEAREQLKAYSVAVKELVEKGKYKTINDALIETVYNDEKHHEFKSYEEWKKEGYQVRKGEKAFLLWGKPKEHPSQQSKENDTPGKEEHSTYFPVIRVFSDAQVVQREHSVEQQKIIEPGVDELKKNELSERKTTKELSHMREDNSLDEIDR